MGLQPVPITKGLKIMQLFIQNYGNNTLLATVEGIDNLKICLTIFDDRIALFATLTDGRYVALSNDISTVRYMRITSLNNCKVWTNYITNRLKIPCTIDSVVINTLVMTP